MSIEDIDFEGQKKEIDSPRSLKACEDLGILPEELFHKKFDDFVKEHPDIINLPIEALKIRYNNIEEYRNKIIAEVKKKRNDIINERLEEAGKSHTYTKNNMDNENEAMEKEITEMKQKGAENLEKIRQKQKNIIESQIEKEVKKEMLRIKTDKKDMRIKELNDKIKEERKQKILMDELKFKEKEKIRKKVLENNMKEREKRNEEKYKAEQRRIQGFQEMQEKNQNEILFRKTQTFKLYEKRKEKILNKLKEEERKNKEKEEKMKRREKEFEELLKKEREERILLGKNKELESIEKMTRNKLKKEKNLETLKKLLDLKEEKTQKRIEGLVSVKNRNLEEQKIRYEKRLKSIGDVLKKSNDEIQKRNDKILRHQLHVNINAEKMGKQKNEKILERVKSQNCLFLSTVRNREKNFKKLQERHDEIKKRLEDKNKKMVVDKINQMKNQTIKQEDDFIRNFERQYNLKRLNRITESKNKKKEVEKSKKEKQVQIHKLKKQNLKEENILLGDTIKKQRGKLLEQIDDVIMKNKDISPELIKELFPEDVEFYRKIKQITDDAYKK